MGDVVVTPFSETLETRQSVIDACLEMTRLGHFIGTWGNVSVRVDDGLLLTPSRVDYDTMTPEDLVVVDWEGNRIRGKRLPTSEMQVHRLILKERPDMGAVIHSHAPWISVLACAGKDFREHLWRASEARDCWSRLLGSVDVLISNRNISEQVLGYSGSDQDLLQRYSDEFGCEFICLTYRETLSSRQGAFRSVAMNAGQLVEGTRREFDIVDRYGTGDAWLAGFLFGFEQKGLQYGLDFAGAMIALAHTVVGDVPYVTKEQVESVLSGHSGLHLRR